MTNNGGSLVTVPDVGGDVSRQDFGGRDLMTGTESASSALAAQAKATVEARFLMAMHRPRDIMAARAKLLKECERPGFADAAIYFKPVGDGIEGPSIRLAEAAARAMGNIHSEAPTIYDDKRQRVIKVVVTDLEANITYDKGVAIAKRVERKSAEGRTVLGQRTNSKKQTVYLVEATDEEILNTENALVSKTLRTLLLRLVPGDIIDDAMAAIRTTRKKNAEANISEDREKMRAAFEKAGVSSDALIKYLGHRIEDLTVEERDHMFSLFTAIKDGEATWAEAFEKRIAEREDAQGKAAKPAQAPVVEATGTPAPAAPAKPTDLKGAAAQAKSKREQAVDREPGAD